MVGTEDRGAERVAPPPLPRRDPADHAVEGRFLLDLDPVPPPGPGLVPARRPLRDDPLEAPRKDRVVVVHPAGRDEVAQDDMLVDDDEVLEDRLPLEEGPRLDLPAAHEEDVEHDVRRGRRPRQAVDPDRVAPVLPLSELREARPAGVHDDDLAVEDRVLPRARADLRIPVLDEGEAAVLESLAVPHEGNRTRAVPLQLEDVLLGVERDLAGLREHGLDEEPVGIGGAGSSGGLPVSIGGSHASPHPDEGLRPHRRAPPRGARPVPPPARPPAAARRKRTVRTARSNAALRFPFRTAETHGGEACVGRGRQRKEGGR